MHHPYLLASEPSVPPPRLPRCRAHLPQLRFIDPAIRAMSDFSRDPAPTIAGETSLARAFDDMFRLGVRAFLVVRDSAVLGLITVEDIRHAGAAEQHSVAEVMTAALDIPAIDWLTLQDARVRDLVEIFDGAGVGQLLVLHNETARSSTVRGVIYRERLERQLLCRADE